MNWTPLREPENRHAIGWQCDVGDEGYTYLVFSEGLDSWTWSLIGPQGEIAALGPSFADPDNAKKSAIKHSASFLA